MIYQFSNHILQVVVDSKIIGSCCFNNAIKYSNGRNLISREISKIEGISKDSRRKKLSSRFILEFVTVLYVHKTITSKKIQDKRAKELIELYEHRMKRHEDYYKGNDLLTSSYIFTYTIIKSWYPGI